MTATTIEPAEQDPMPASAAGVGARGVDAGMLGLTPFLIMLYSACLPQEVRLVVGGLSIYPYRMAAFVLLPWLLNRLFRGQIRLTAIDAMVLAGALWMQISFIVFYGATEGLVRGGALLIDILPPFFVARICVRSPLDLRRIIVLAVPVLIFVGVSMLIESISGQALIRPWAASQFGPLSSYENGVEVGLFDGAFDYRLGMLRAAGPFPHPILAGLFLASFLPLILQGGLKRWPLYFGVLAGMLAVFSISSAAWLSLVLALVLVAYDRIQQKVEILNWQGGLVAGGIVLIGLQAASQSGLISVLIRFTLNPGTAYYRKMIWDFGIRSVERNPWFGIGYTDFERATWMTNSVDNHWLLLAIRHGFLPSVLFLAVCGVLIFRLSATSLSLAEPDRRLFVGVAIALFALVLAGFTVAFVGGMHTWLFLLLGAATSVSFAIPFSGVSTLNRRLG
ncbi:MAG: hypothetical protein EP350_09795 [Alphaproteobacteria bacterium]|nr:MAG: hypothetical protein EP350_09795 [Alphaproteobacteria bacterium]